MTLRIMHWIEWEHIAHRWRMMRIHWKMLHIMPWDFFFWSTDVPHVPLSAPVFTCRQFFSRLKTVSHFFCSRIFGLPRKMVLSWFLSTFCFSHHKSRLHTSNMPDIVLKWIPRNLNEIFFNENIKIIIRDGICFSIYKSIATFGHEPIKVAWKSSMHRRGLYIQYLFD